MKAGVAKLSSVLLGLAVCVPLAACEARSIPRGREQRVWVSASDQATSPDAPERAGYWLSAELWGPAPAVARAVESLGRETLERRIYDRPPPGELVGWVSDRDQAMRWVTHHAFEEPPERSERRVSLRDVPAPAPGGTLFEKSSIVVGALIISKATTRGEVQDVSWPTDPDELLPADSSWAAADLVVERAPLFAAPASALPPLRESHAMAERSGSLFVADVIDRCDPQGVCLRWARVVSRVGSRFTAGYLPAHQLALRAAWIPDPETLPRVTVSASVLEPRHAKSWVLYRDADGRMYRHVVELPRSPDGFLPAFPQLDGDRVTIRAGSVTHQLAPGQLGGGGNANPEP